MKNLPFSLNAKTIALAVAAFAWLTTLAAPVLAQATPQTQPATTGNMERQNQMDLSRREWKLRNMTNTPDDSASDSKLVEATMAQVDQDFKRILTLHNKMVRIISASTPIDYGFVSDATAEIKKRAARLRSTLKLDKPEGETNAAVQTEFNDKQMKDGLIALCKSIKSFVTNPVIETPGTVSAPALTKARKDLETVIELSSNLRKSADKLKRPVQ